MSAQDPNANGSAEVTAADIAAVQAPPQPEAPPVRPEAGSGGPFRVELPTGQVYSGNTQEELLAQLVRAQTSASETINRLKEQVAMRDMQQQLPAQSQSVPQGPAFDVNTYWQLQATAPLQAQHYLMQAYTGLENPQSAMKQAYLMAETVSQGQAVNEFKNANPDFPQTAEAGELVAARHALAFGAEAPVTAASLEVAYRQLIREGVVRPVQYVTPPGQSRGAAAPPAIGSGGAGYAPDIDENVLGRLTTDQLRQLMINKGLIR